MNNKTKARELPEIYQSCAHPQSVWFEEHWRPIFDSLVKENEELEREVEMSRDRARLNMQSAEKLEKENEELKSSLIDAVEALEFFVIGNYSIMEVENLARQALTKLKSQHKFLGEEK